MIAFEITINDEPARTIAIGEFGYLCADVFWVRLPNKSGGITEELRMHPYGYDPSSHEWLHWLNTNCKVGDEISIRILEVEDTCEPPSERIVKKHSFASERFSNKMRGME